MTFAWRRDWRRALPVNMAPSGLTGELVLARRPDSVRVWTQGSLVGFLDAAEDAVTFPHPAFGAPLLGHLLRPFPSGFPCSLVRHFRSVPRSTDHNASTRSANPWPPPMHAEPIPQRPPRRLSS